MLNRNIISSPFLKARAWFWGILVLSAIGLFLLWPGDLPWTEDGLSIQHSSILIAHQANHLKKLALSGQQGSVGITYHPLPIWLLQSLLLITENLIWVSLIKNFVFSLIAVVCLYYLSKELSYPSYPLILFFLSLHCSFYSRALFGSTFLLPVLFFLFAAYAWFYKKRTRLPFICILICLVALFHLNLQVFLSAGLSLFAVFILLDYKWIKAHPVFTITCSACAFLISAPYLYTVLMQLLQASVKTPWLYSDAVGKILLSTVTGGVIFSYSDVYLHADNMMISKWPFVIDGIRILLHITKISYFFIVSGIVISVATLTMKFKNSSPWSLQDRFGLWALLAIIFFTSTMILFQIFPFPHYLVAMWIFYFFFLWRTVNTFQNKKFVRYIFPIYLIATTIIWTTWLFNNHYNRSGPYLSLGNIVETAKTISQYSPESDIYQLVDLSAKGKEWVDNNLHNMAIKKELDSFYYREMLHIMDRNYTEREKKRLSLQYDKSPLYLALVPLLNIYYHGKDLQSLPSQPLLIKYRGDHKNEIEVVQEPERVRLELKEMGEFQHVK